MVRAFPAFVAAVSMCSLLAGCSDGGEAGLPEGVSVSRGIAFTLDTDGEVERNVTYAFTSATRTVHDSEMTASDGMAFRYTLYAPTVRKGEPLTLTVGEEGHPDISKEIRYEDCPKGSIVDILLRGTATATIRKTCR